MDIDGLIFETFAWNFTHSSAAAGMQHTPATPPPQQPHQPSAGSCTKPPSSPSRPPTADAFLSAASSSSTAVHHPINEGNSRELGGIDSSRPTTPAATANNNSSSTPAHASTPTRAHNGSSSAGMGAATPPASPFAAVDGADSMVTSIPLKPGGTHLKVRVFLCAGGSDTFLQQRREG
eukprot:1161127-Pelagomonas_calceolata.AAC.17